MREYFPLQYHTSCISTVVNAGFEPNTAALKGPLLNHHSAAQELSIVSYPFVGNDLKETSVWCVDYL